MAIVGQDYVTYPRFGVGNTGLLPEKPLLCYTMDIFLAVGTIFYVSAERFSTCCEVSTEKVSSWKARSTAIEGQRSQKREKRSVPGFRGLRPARNTRVFYTQKKKDLRQTLMTVAHTLNSSTGLLLVTWAKIKKTNNQVIYSFFLICVYYL